MLHRGARLSQEAGDRYGEGVALVNIGDVLLGLHRTDEAIDWLARAHEVFTDLGYADGVGYAAHAKGRCYLSAGRDAEALDCFSEALASHQASGNRRRQAVTLRFLGHAQARAIT